jgi:hypothetical protein
VGVDGFAIVSGDRQIASGGRQIASDGRQIGLNAASDSKYEGV